MGSLFLFATVTLGLVVATFVVFAALTLATVAVAATPATGHRAAVLTVPYLVYVADTPAVAVEVAVRMIVVEAYFPIYTPSGFK
tara:strand:+ start:804 stop:1055 length:252 start_codon:yes stop_codon:yes gene_type:complete